MALLTWTQDLNTGIEKIDNEHRKIVDFINQLDEIKDNHDQAQVGEVLNGLIEYTATHFYEEEQMMEQAGYPLTEIHKGVHRRFVDKVSDLATQHANGADTLAEIMHLLENWLFSHIRMNDHGYVPTVEKARVAGKL